MNSELQRKFMARLGAYESSKGLDTLRREDFPSEAAYLDACARYDVANSDPRMVEARRKVQSEYEAKKEAEREKKWKAEVEKATRTVVLSNYDNEACESNARREAEKELAFGRINAAQLGGRISELYKKNVEDKKRSVVNSKMMSAMFREASGQHVDIDDALGTADPVVKY